ncbi:MAG: hypothetical protein ACM3PP_08300 [Candidatus Saccharibacteria bacterium]
MNTSQVLSTILILTLIVIPFVLVTPVVAADWNYEELPKSFNNYNNSNNGSLAGFILLGLMVVAVGVLCIAGMFQKKQEKRSHHKELDRIREFDHVRDFDRHRPAV